AVIGRNSSPAEQRLAFRLNDLSEHLFELATGGGIARQEDQAAAVLSFGGKSDPRFLSRFRQKLVRHLNKDAGAVTGVHLCAAGSAMIEIGEHLQALLEDLVGLAALDVDNEAN